MEASVAGKAPKANAATEANQMPAGLVMVSGFFVSVSQHLLIAK